jgi:hypothetical protein
MGLNDQHREMEGPDDTPLDSMARLTWWRYDKSHDVYENVISKRRIPGTEWKAEYNDFVQLDETAGQSWTKVFQPSVHSMPGPVAALHYPPATGVGAVTQQMDKMAL